MTVRTTWMSLILLDSMVWSSSAGATKPASLPGAIDPSIASSCEAWAPFTVLMRKASSRVMRWLAPQTSPFQPVRVAAARQRDWGAPADHACRAEGRELEPTLPRSCLRLLADADEVSEACVSREPVHGQLVLAAQEPALPRIWVSLIATSESGCQPSGDFF